MKKIIFVVFLLSIPNPYLNAFESRFMTTAPAGYIVGGEPAQPPPEFKDLQAEIVKLRAEIKKQNKLINQLKATSIALKKENKIMRQSLLDANLLLPNLLEQSEQEQQKLDEENQKKEAAEKAEALIKSHFSRPLSVGQIARLDNFKTIQIIDSNNMIVEWLDGYTSGRYGSRITETIWIKGINTQNMADEQRVEVREQAFKITGTKTYEVVMGGTRTVFVLEPYP